MPSITLTKVRKVAATGRVYLRFSDDKILEFANEAEVVDWAKEIDLDDDRVRDYLRRLLVRWWLHRNPTGDNPSSIEGKRIVLSLADSAPLVVDNG